MLSMLKQKSSVVSRVWKFDDGLSTYFRIAYLQFKSNQKKGGTSPIRLLAHGFVLVTHCPLKHLIDADWLPEVPGVVVHTPFTHVTVTHVPLLHVVLCVTDWLVEDVEEDVCALAAWNVPRPTTRIPNSIVEYTIVPLDFILLIFYNRTI